MLPHAAAIERSQSQYSVTHTKHRNRLHHVKVADINKVKSKLHTMQRDNGTRKIRLSNAKLKGHNKRRRTANNAMPTNNEDEADEGEDLGIGAALASQASSLICSTEELHAEVESWFNSMDIESAKINNGKPI